MQSFPFILQIRTIICVYIVALSFNLCAEKLAQSQRRQSCVVFPNTRRRRRKKKTSRSQEGVYPEASTRDVILSEPSCLRTRSAEVEHLISVAYRTSVSVWFSDLGDVIKNGHDAHRGSEKKGQCSSNNSQCSVNSHLRCRSLSESL